MGAGVTDVVKGELGGKVEGIWYTKKIKAEMFNNLKLLMMRPQGKLYIPNYMTMSNPIVKKMYFQFLSITQEFKDNDATRTPTISHQQRTHDDIINAVALAALYFRLNNSRRSYPLKGFTATK